MGKKYRTISNGYVSMDVCEGDLVMAKKSYEVFKVKKPFYTPKRMLVEDREGILHALETKEVLGKPMGSDKHFTKDSREEG